MQSSLWLTRLQQDLEERQRINGYRVRKTFELDEAGTTSRFLVHDGRRLLNFSSNDYLGLAAHDSVKRATQDAIAKQGFGSTASHLVCGHHSLHEELERRIAEWLGRDRALVFSSGFMANVGTLTSIITDKDRVFLDRLSHASLIDGVRYSAAQFRRYPHLALSKLENLLSKSSGSSGQAFVATDGVFSMDGTVAPMDRLIELCSRYDAVPIMDDAHGFGVYGENGRGLIDVYGLSQGDLPIVIGTFGKAFGGAGAFVAGSELVIETLIQRARSYIYTTASPPSISAAAIESLNIIQQQPSLRQHLRSLSMLFREKLQALLSMKKAVAETENFKLIADEASPIQPLVLGSNELSLSMSDFLYDRGFIAQAIRPPTVPKGEARIRFTFTASHQQQDVLQLVEAISDWLQA